MPGLETQDGKGDVMVRTWKLVLGCGLLAAGMCGALALSGPALADGEVLYPGKYFGRVDLPLPQAFRHLKRLIGNTDNFEPINNFSQNNRYRVMAAPIGRLDLLVRDQGREQVAVCTAWLVSADLAVTNHHCIPGEEGELLKASLLMNYLKEGKTDTVERYGVNIQPVETNAELDFSVIRIDGSPGNKYGVIPLVTRDPLPNEELFMIQHPAGKPKRLTRRNCRADADTERPEEMRHFCDTLGGSSGSPVFSDNDMALLGLHFAGLEKQVNFAKRIKVIIASSRILGQLGQGAPPPSTTSGTDTTQPSTRSTPGTQETAPAASGTTGGWQSIN